MASFEFFVEVRERGAIGWLHPDLQKQGLAAFWAPLEPLPDAKGRGGVGCLSIDGRNLVVRPYRRGGALGGLLRDRYSGPSRARRELLLLEELRQQGVPVVVPMAAVAKRGRAFWRLRLCTERIAEALPLPAFLRAHPSRRAQVAEAAGTVLRLAFAVGLRHPDLHVDNILCCCRGDKVRVVLVDLDRASLKKPLPERSRDEMFVRMQRYIERHRSTLAAVPTRAETMRFLRTFWPEVVARHAAWRHLRRLVERALRRRFLRP